MRIESNPNFPVDLEGWGSNEADGCLIMENLVSHNRVFQQSFHAQEVSVGPVEFSGIEGWVVGHGDRKVK